MNLKNVKKQDGSYRVMYKELSKLKYSFDSNEVRQNIENITDNFPSFFIFNAICYSNIHHKVDKFRISFKTSLVSSLYALLLSITSNKSNSLELDDLALSVKCLITFLSGQKIKLNCLSALTKNSTEHNEIQMIDFPKKLYELYGEKIKTHGTKWTKAIYKIVENDIEKNKTLQSELIYNYIGGNGYTGPLTNDSLLRTAISHSISKDFTTTNPKTCMKRNLEHLQDLVE